jgi:hypothetical protein
MQVAFWHVFVTVFSGFRSLPAGLKGQGELLAAAAAAAAAGCLDSSSASASVISGGSKIVGEVCHWQGQAWRRQGAEEDTASSGDGCRC